MKKWMVENRKDYTDIFDNYVGDYIEAETEEEAVEFAKAYFIENGCDPEEVEEWEYQVKEYRN